MHMEELYHIDMLEKDMGLQLRLRCMASSFKKFLDKGPLSF